MLLERHSPNFPVTRRRRHSGNSPPASSSFSNSSPSSNALSGGMPTGDSAVRLPPMRLYSSSHVPQLHHPPLKYHVPLPQHSPPHSLAVPAPGRQSSKDIGPRVRRLSSMIDYPSPASTATSVATNSPRHSVSFLPSTNHNLPYQLSLNEIEVSQSRTNSLDLDMSRSKRGSANPTEAKVNDLRRGAGEYVESHERGGKFTYSDDSPTFMSHSREYRGFRSVQHSPRICPPVTIPRPQSQQQYR